MTFRQKIDKILEIKKLSMHKLNKDSGFGQGTISARYEADDDFSPVYKEKFLAAWNINPAWWETGEGEIFTKNGTYVETRSKEKDPDQLIGILTRNLDRMGELNEFLLGIVKRYKDRYGDI